MPRSSMTSDSVSIPVMHFQNAQDLAAEADLGVLDVLFQRDDAKALLARDARDDAARGHFLGSDARDDARARVPGGVRV